MLKKRIQLTLFVSEKNSGQIEKIRQKFNPAQYALIKSHVTLCREEKLEQLDRVIDNLEKLEYEAITIHFGGAIRFANGTGVLLPAIGNRDEYHTLREKILQGISNNQDIPEPHITLMHPRNSLCTDEIFEQIKNYNLPTRLTFSTISLIEQEPRMEWQVLRQFKLRNKQ
jgi:cellobiose-specific phosphotransferase system component IIA